MYFFKPDPSPPTIDSSSDPSFGPSFGPSFAPSFNTAEITIGILTRNSIRTLAETLASLSAQSLSTRRWQVLFVDHNSHDGTRQLLEEYVARHDNASLMSRAENNLSRSRQTIVDQGKSKWIVFIDSDIVLPTHWLATALACADERAGNREFSGVGASLKLSPKSAALRELEIMQQHFLGHFGTEQMMTTFAARRVSHLPTAAALFRRESLVAAGGFDPDCGQCGEDLEIGERMTHAGREFWILPELQATHIFSCVTVYHWVSRAFRFGRARIKVATLHPHLWWHLRVIAPLTMLGLQLTLPLLAMILLATKTSMVGSAVLGWLVLPAADFAFLVASFALITSLRRAFRVAWLALLTHFFYSWGQGYQVLHQVLHQVSALAWSRESRPPGRRDDIEVVNLPGWRISVPVERLGSVGLEGATDTARKMGIRV